MFEKLPSLYLANLPCEFNTSEVSFGFIGVILNDETQFSVNLLCRLDVNKYDVAFCMKVCLKTRTTVCNNLPWKWTDPDGRPVDFPFKNRGDFFLKVMLGEDDTFKVKLNDRLSLVFPFRTNDMVSDISINGDLKLSNVTFSKAAF
ncbi:hypothetical protein Btru_066865 [Bulinus truncatus]|nr:hypothetical protein Btru_066865 [Bulinus truncatus]